MGKLWRNRHALAHALRLLRQAVDGARDLIEVRNRISELAQAGGFDDAVGHIKGGSKLVRNYLDSLEQ